MARIPLRPTRLAGTLLTGAALTLAFGCSAPQHANSPRQGAMWAIEPLHDREVSEPHGRPSWVATPSLASGNGALAARRDQTLLGRPPVSPTDASVWPGPAAPEERRRIPTIFSRWGTSF